MGQVRRPAVRGAIARAMEADDAGIVDAPGARAIRKFAERTGADRLALAAIQRAPVGAPAALGDIVVPTLVLTGDADVLVGPPDVLARKIPGATYQLLRGNHLSAVSDPAFARSIVDFIAAVPAG